MNERLPSWHATGLIEKAWQRIKPPTRQELARRMNVEGADLSARNTSTAQKPRTKQRRLTLDYAERIVTAVRQDDPTFGLADLGAPLSALAVEDPTVLDRLEELATALGVLTSKVDTGLELMNKRLRTLENGGDPRAAPARPTSQRRRKVTG